MTGVKMTPINSVASRMLKAPAQKTGRPYVRPIKYCQAECGERCDDQESRNRAGRCVIRDERRGHDGEQGEPDAKMELETVLLRIGDRPVDA